MEITNGSKAPQGVHSVSGVVYVMPGETKSVELTAEGFKGASRLQFLTIEGDAPDDKAVDKQELLAKLKALGVDANGNSKAETLQKKLDETLAAQAEAKQVVIAELKALGVEFDEAAPLADLQSALAAAKPQ